MAKLKIKQVKKYICDTCHGNGYVRVATHDRPQLDFRDDSQVHLCWDCDSDIPITMASIANKSFNLFYF